MAQLAFSEHLFDEPAVAEGDPIIAPLVREQLEALVGGPRDGGIGGPERALMRALLQDAVLCLMGQAAPAKERARLAEDARYWIRSRSRDWVFSFANVCEVLGIDADGARRKLLAMSGSDEADGEETMPRDENALRGVRGLRRCGQRPRRAIHFMRTRRRRGASVEADSES
jgi:hypothetical protein